MSCPNCYFDEFIVSFSWDDARSDSTHLCHHLLNDFKYDKQLPWEGQLYISVCCKTTWLLLPNGRMNLVSPKQKAYFEKAQQHNHHVNDDFIKILQQIGVVEINDKFGSLHFPCKVTLKTKQIIECATVLLGGINQDFFHTHIFKAYEGLLPYYFIDEVENITTSPYALSHETRLWSANAPEIAMGVTPYCLQNNHGLSFICNGYIEFSNIPQIGDNLLYPVKEQFTRDNLPQSPQHPERPLEAYIISHDPRFYKNYRGACYSSDDNHLHVKGVKDLVIAYLE